MIYIFISHQRKHAFTLQFTENYILQQYNSTLTKSTFLYNELKSVHHLSSSKFSSLLFIIHNNGDIYKIRTDIPSNKKFIELIYFLKTKNKDFETYISPKGTDLHRLLRQEILDIEY